MPRAKPSRSGYCASRHLLRNLDDPRELRRNPLAAEYFCSSSRSRRRTPEEDRRALERICGLVREALGALYVAAEGDRDGAHLGRMHAALLRCEIDRGAPDVVAAELGLSERQLRRERSAAHDAFLRSFRHVAECDRLPATRGSDALPAIVGGDVAQVRLAEAVELHAVGKSRLGLAVFASIAASAPHAATRIEALCLATEAELDAGRLPEARALVDEATAISALHGEKLSEAERDLVAEHIEFLEWSLRWQLGLGAGVAMKPPSVISKPAPNDNNVDKEHALRVRALAAFATQRWEVGDTAQGRSAVRVAQTLLRSLHGSRVAERLAVMHISLRLSALCGSESDKDSERLRAIEELASKAGHVRPRLAARADRLSLEAERLRSAAGTFDGVFADCGVPERGSLGRTLAYVACVAAQWEPDGCRAMRAADLAEAHVAPGSGIALLASSMRARRAIGCGRYVEARLIADTVRREAAQCGNNRFRGSADRDLAMIALAQGRTRDARRLICDAMPILERYGSYRALAEASEIARRVGVH